MRGPAPWLPARATRFIQVLAESLDLFVVRSVANAILRWFRVARQFAFPPAFLFGPLALALGALPFDAFFGPQIVAVLGQRRPEGQSEPSDAEDYRQAESRRDAPAKSLS